MLAWHGTYKAHEWQSGDGRRGGLLPSWVMLRARTTKALRGTLRIV